MGRIFLVGCSGHTDMWVYSSSDVVAVLRSLLRRSRVQRCERGWRSSRRDASCSLCTSFPFVKGIARC